MPTLTPELLRAATGCSPDLAQRYAGPLGAACAVYHIDTQARLAAFLAQVGHESGSLRYAQEVWGPTSVQTRYEGRRDLGNTEPGDGYRYRGRGLLQTTGRANYRALTGRLRARFHAAPDFEAEPDELLDADWAAISAADYWDMRALNALADRGDVIGIGRAINRGSATAVLPANGEADRMRRWHLARQALAEPSSTTGRRHDDTPTPRTQAPEGAPPPAIPQTENTMPLPTFGWTLVSGLINAFSPLAREKITKEVGRHSDRPEVAEQVADALIGAAKEATGMSDPLEAIVQARQNPAVMEQLETRAIEEIERLAPLLERMQAWEMQAHQATEDSRRAADERARASLQDQDPFLTRSIVWLMVAVLLGLAVLIGVLAGLGKDVQVLVGLLATLIGGVAAKFGTRFDHRYGTSASSAAKDALIDRVSIKAPPGTGRAGPRGAG